MTPLKYGRVKDSINLVESRIPINWVESWTLLKFGRVKDSINLVKSRIPINWIKSRTLVEKILNQHLREFLFGNFQI